MKRASWLVLLCVALGGCEGRQRFVDESGKAAAADKSTPATDSEEDDDDRDGKLLAIDLGAGAPESAQGGLFGPPPNRSYSDLLKALKGAQEDEDAGALYVRIGTAGLGFARTEEVGRELQKIRKSGKPVVCHAHVLSNTSAWLAAQGCDRIWLSPSGDVETVGLATQVVYLRGVLDKLGVDADFIHMGKYKSFAEQFTREGPSDAAKESLIGALGSIRGHWLDGVSAARKGANVKSSLEDGPWSAEQAKAQGLIDEVGYESDAVKDAKDRANAKDVRLVYGPGSKPQGSFDLAGLIRSISGASERSGGADKVVVIPTVGAIAMGASGGLLGGGDGISAKALTKKLRRLREDKAVKAVVLRIDSPGGSALASDLLWHELMRLKEKKPIVASIGAMAASGGYYMACVANKIVAERTSIVGSIGVVGGKFTLDRALARHGLNAVTIPMSDRPGAAERAGLSSPLTPWDDATREKMRSLMGSAYDLFLKRVAEGRGSKVEDIEPHAGGRIWSGSQGVDRKLVDETGGLTRAVALARELGELETDAPVVVEGNQEGLLELLSVDENASAEEIELALQRVRAQQPKWLDELTGPLRPFAQSFLPLLEGEHTLAALPFALIVR